MTNHITRLRRERRRRGLSQVALAYQAGMTPPEISKIENGWGSALPQAGPEAGRRPWPFRG